MARYTCSTHVALPLAEIYPLLKQTFERCGFEVIHQGQDYMMAREKPCGITYNRLVTAEALIDHTSATAEKVNVRYVVKNEELPLKSDNYCHRRFEDLLQQLREDERWNLLDLLVG